jgi:hypothetical protein
MAVRTCDHDRLLDAALALEVREVSDECRQQAIARAWLEDVGPPWKAAPDSRRPPKGIT